VIASRSESPRPCAYLDLIGLPPLMALTSGRPEISIGLIDGPVVINHPDLAAENIYEVPGKLPGACAGSSDAACAHGTFMAGILLARRGSTAPGICPGCSLLVRPIFAGTASNGQQVPSATPEELAKAIIDVIDLGARIVNLSAALVRASSKSERELEQALDYAMRRGVLVVAAAGNQAALGSSVITRHPWVIPVVAYDLQGRPMSLSNLGASIGRRGLGAPGEEIVSLGATEEPLKMGGTSVATAFVTGSVALIWSEFPAASAANVRSAAIRAAAPRRTTIVPPLVDAWAGHQTMSKGFT
jgi:subtilisin family serine protease